MKTVKELKRLISEYLHNHAEALREGYEKQAEILQNDIDMALLDLKTHQLRLAAEITRCDIALNNAYMSERPNCIWTLEAELQTISEDHDEAHCVGFFSPAMITVEV